MRPASEQSIPNELVRRIADLTARFAELSDYVRLATSASDWNTRAIEVENVSRPIEFLTENGFGIVRCWEADGSPTPTHGSFCFRVRDPQDHESRVTVDIAEQVIKETAFNTRGRIAFSSPFWICCAERHLADYLTEHDSCPDGYQLLVEFLDCEEVVLALRWEKSD